MIFEVCAYNIQSAIIAEKAGAGRIELCSDPAHGGITPSYGAIQYALEHLSVPIFPMIRPSLGDYIYDGHELAIIRKDILVCRELGCPGIATGVVLPGGQIDVEQMKRIVDWAHPMAVTCHKAFDGTPDALQALEDLISAGCSRILTSGLQKTAIEGAGTLARLVVQAAGRIVIMPGGAVRSGNISQLIAQTHASEYHSSCITAKGEKYLADEAEVRAIVDKLTA